jgi:hypothetical protein
MNYIRFLPMELESVVGDEKIDFSVFANRKKPVKQSFNLIFGGIFWLAITSIFVVVFFGPLFKGEEVHFSVDGVPTTASLENFEPMIVPALIIGLFVLIGIGLLLYGFYSFSQKGGYFVGTANRLFHYHKGIIKSFDWEQFSGNMEINIKKGDIALQLRTGKMVSRKNSSARYVPDVVYISGVTEVLEIEKMCRKRIKENDPTPANTSKYE